MQAPAIIGSEQSLKATSGPSIAGPVILSLPDESLGPPVYAGIASWFMNTDGEWVAIELIRERSCVPATFNLLQFVDIPGAFGCALTITGKEWWHPEDLANGPWTSIPPFPFEARLVGSSGMLMYFVKLSELTAAIADGVLTIGELESLPSFLRGYVDSYLQVQHNSNQAERTGHSETIAGGTLEDGRAFFYQKTDRGDRTLSATITFR
jgi:hypothetical protein